MSKQEIETRIETLKMAVAINSRFLASVPSGADKATEKQVELDKEELVKLRAELEAA
jgi:hypothetical protein